MLDFGSPRKAKSVKVGKVILKKAKVYYVYRRNSELLVSILP